ncbi:radical SAM protein [bacterium]|nr:radical SAM protein [bacterium]
MQLRRFKDIIAIKNDTGVVLNDTITAFHASNLEVAEIDQETFDKMTEISVFTGEIPKDKIDLESSAFNALAEWNSELNPDAKSGKMEFGIRSITLNVNQICNLKCAYCAAGGDGTYGTPTTQISVEKTLPQLKYFLSSVKPGQTFAISFVGGEPLLHPKAIKAINAYVITESSKYQIKPKFKIVTNGTLIKDETLEILRSMNVDLTISFDGTKEANDIARPSKDGSSTTEKILIGLAQLQKNRGQISSINFSAITSTTNTNVFENYIYLKSLNPDSIEFVFANDEKDPAVQQKHIEGLNKILAHAWTAGGEKELRKIKSVDHYFYMLDNQQKTENFCGAGKNYLMVDAKNKLYSCVWDANLKEESVGSNEQLDHEKLSKLSKSLIELNNCNTCWARFLCGGGCMHINRSHNGDKHKKSILFCERTRSLILQVLMYYKLARAANP